MNERLLYLHFSNKKNGTLYVEVTNNILRRVWEHKQGLIEGFTKKYNVDRLVYFEQTNVVEEAILREKQIKKWNRQWKLRLIEKINPHWIDLYDQMTGFPPSRE